MIASDRPIRGTLAAAPGTPPDIVAHWWPTVAAPAVEEPVWSGGAGAACFSAPGIARYRLARGSIEVTPVAGAADEMVEALLIATAIPALLWLEGAFVLHAAAVVPAGGKGALAIAGASGSGKSRLAAALVARGGALVADDSVAVEWRGGRAIGAGLAGGYHLGDPDAAERPFHRVPGDRARASAPLSAVVMLGEDGAAGRLGGVDAVAALLAERHRASVPRRYGLEARGLADAARLARAVPVHRLARGDADALLDDAARDAMTGDGSR